MSRRGGWKRSSWQDAASEIGQALEPTAQPGEELRQLADAQIADSPYQARASYDDAQIAELAQGMAEAGFQGVVFVRPHPDGPVDGRERYQLVYGHRRRRAWRQLCAARGVPCVVPAIVRPFSDRQMLTIGAQENLQREDLNPMEEARLVLWHQELYYPAGLGEIGRMLGKSEDWAKTRSRLAQLPESLQAVVWRAPAMMTAALEIARLWASAPERAEALAARAEREGLNLRQIRQLVAAALAPARSTAREDVHDRRVDPPLVMGGTSEMADREDIHEQRVDAPNVPDFTKSGSASAEARAQIAAEADATLAHLQRWRRLAEDPAHQEAIGRSCERILLEINAIIEAIARS